MSKEKIAIILCVLIFLVGFYKLFNLSEMFRMISVVPKYPKALIWYPNFGANGPISDQPNQRQRWEIVTKIKKVDTFGNFINYYHSKLLASGWKTTYGNQSVVTYEKKTKNGLYRITISNWREWEDHIPTIDFSYLNQADLSEEILNRFKTN